MPKTNAWKCVCGCEMVRLTVLKCTACGKAKESGESLLKKKDDWICVNCKCNNFAARTHCYRCKKKKMMLALNL